VEVALAGQEALSRWSNDRSRSSGKGDAKDKEVGADDRSRGRRRWREKKAQAAGKEAQR